MLRRVLANGTLTTVAGIPGTSGVSDDGLPALASRLALPVSVAAYLGGFVIVNAGSCRIAMLWPNATLTRLAGSGVGGCGFAGDGGPAVLALLNPLTGAIAADPWGPGGVVFADSGNNVVRRVLPNGVVVRVAGTGGAGFSGQYGVPRVWFLATRHDAAPCAGDFGFATSATLNRCNGVAPDGNGGLFIAGALQWGQHAMHFLYSRRFSSYAPRFSATDSANHCIRFVSTRGVITTAAGTCGMSGYLGTTEQQRVRMLGRVQRGNDFACAGDGEPATAPSGLLNLPTSVAYDGGFFVSELGNQVIRYVTAAGVLTTVAGTPGVAGSSGDGGLALAARLSDPLVSADGLGGWIIADVGNVVVRRLALQTATQTPSAVPTPSASPSVAARSWNIFRAAGSGALGSTGDGGPATAATIGSPGVACKDGAGGFLFVSFSVCSRLHRGARPHLPRFLLCRRTRTRTPQNACTPTAPS